MKKINLLIILLALAFGFTACVDLDTRPEGSTITDEDKADVIEKNPNRLKADLAGMHAKLIEYGITFDFAGTNHSDYGHAAICLALENAGVDMVNDETGYNWFSAWANLGGSRNYISQAAYFPWILYYSHIRQANNILLMAPRAAVEENVELANFRGQALASRAFDYLMLVQMYQFTYIGNQDKLAVPIVDETMTGDQIANNRRATVQAVYDFIMADLNESIELLAKNPAGGKGAYEINLNTAHGLRARANLLMGKWDDAAKDAEIAMQGFEPYSIKDLSIPAFNEITTTNSWIWGNVIQKENDVVQTGIINWSSHLCSWTGNGYTTLTGTHRRIFQPLFEKIPDTDIRKGWWVDQNLKSPIVDNFVTPELAAAYASALRWVPFTNVKFGPQDNVPRNSENSQDWPMMRVEEMILIKAEAEAMGSAGVAQAKTTLENFVKTYRDPSYTVTATSKEDFREEVWFQRRIELWGEGFSFFDIMRLEKPIKRFENGKTNHTTPSIIYDIKPNDPVLLLRIPETEIITNKGIPSDQNNPLTSRPTAVTPY